MSDLLDDWKEIDPKESSQIATKRLYWKYALWLFLIRVGSRWLLYGSLIKKGMGDRYFISSRAKETVE